MATDLAEILSDLRREAKASPRDEATTAVDARLALSRLRPALQRLRDDGISDPASTNADPDAFRRQADRVHWVDLLAGACDRLGAATPEPEQPGRLTQLADAAAVAATVDVESLTSNQRWTIAAALGRTAHHLTGAAGGQESAEIARAVIVAEASSHVLLQFASVDLTTPADLAVLRRPVPNPAPELASLDDALLEASAALVHTTRPGTGPHMIADVLAVATAAKTVCARVALARSHDSTSTGAASDASAAWSDVQEKLAPFNDGSRRPQPDRPPAVRHALALHRMLRDAGAEPAASRTDQPTPAHLDLVVGRLAEVAGHLDSAVGEAASRGVYMAYAADLPFRESRVMQVLDGHRVTGLVTADSDDLAPVRTALRRAHVASAGLARIRPPVMSVERRAAAFSSSGASRLR